VIQIHLVLYTDTHREAGMAETKVRGRRSTANIRRKNLNIDQAKLDRVRELLGARTETEAVDQALSALLLREELIAGVRRVAGSGGVENVFEGDVER
jgi:Bacterial antitoxin of type II TA system, VapB